MVKISGALAPLLFCTGCSILPAGVDKAKIVNDILASPAALVAIVAAGLAFLSGVLGPLVQVHIGRRAAAASQRSADAAMLSAQTAGAREIAKLRMSWIETLRNKLSEYHSILMNLESDEDDGAALDAAAATAKIDSDNRKLSELGTQLDLLLNLNDPLQKALWDISDKIYKTSGQAAREALDEPLIQAGRAVMMAEWERVKAEMQGAPFDGRR